MTAANWITIVGLLVGFMIQASLYAFFMGKLSARVQGLEARPVDTDCKTELAAVHATMNALLGRMDSTERTMRELLLRQPGHVT